MNRTLHSTLLALEELLLTPTIRRDCAAVERLLAEEFEEIGKGGNRYDRAAILDLMASEPSLEQAVLLEFKATPLGQDSAFVTYTSITGGRNVYRTSVWSYRESRWQMLHHQGTLAAVE